MTAISFDQWLALNDEIVALVRAGVPLESGLAGMARELRGRERRTALRISEGLARGEPLPQVLADPQVGCPPLYRAVVEAGLKSGRLALALEQLAASARRLAELRGAVGRALVYPLLVVALASVLLLFFAVKIAPVLAAAIPDFDLEEDRFLTWLAHVGRTDGGGLLLLPIVVVGVAVAWWLLSGISLTRQPVWSGWVFAWVPGARRMLRLGRAATLAEVSALLVEQQVPLDEALRLAAESTGDKALARSVDELSADIRAGRASSKAGRGIPGVPPFLVWLLGSSGPSGGMATALRHAADSYRRRAIHQAELARIVTPVLLTVGVGGSATLAYALSLFIPWTTFLRNLAS